MTAASLRLRLDHRSSFGTSVKRQTSAHRALWASLVCVAGILAVPQDRYAAAQTEIHRCEQPDGSVAFQGTPCEELSPAATLPDEAGSKNGDEASDAATSTSSDDDVFASPFDAPAEPAAPSPANGGPPSEERASCEKRTRDAIDAIDLEIGQETSADQRDQYLPRLRKLTEELRACKLL